MKSAAWRHAAGGATSPEIRLSRAIERFGVVAVMGRPVLWAREANAIKTAEAIVNAYHARERSDNWAAWANQHPEMQALLVEAQKLAEDSG